MPSFLMPADMFPNSDPRIVTKLPQAVANCLFALLTHAGNEKDIRQIAASLAGPGLSLAASLAKGEGTQLHFSGDVRIAIIGIGKIGDPDDFLEEVRDGVQSGVTLCNDYRIGSIVVCCPGTRIPGLFRGISEALCLSNYQYLTFKTRKKSNALKSASVFAPANEKNEIEAGRISAQVTCMARDLVNEPVITLTAQALSAKAVALAKEYGFSAEVFDKKKINTLRMGGLLAVNAGSVLPPTFTILEWKPSRKVNSRPVVLVGKGVVFDTGGLSLKETSNSMDFMKSDMAGAAAVIGAICGCAARKLPVHVIGLIPATDNRPGGNAITPGDVITMYDGTTVEVMNTDAEGRLILADALSFARKYEPELVIDLATLTGAAVVVAGSRGIVMMGTAESKVKDRLRKAGLRSRERLIELPLWNEYQEQLKSDIADLKNVGGRPAGTITAGKFLQYFTRYPWIHFDIAGTAFLSGSDSYRGKGGTGSGVRLLLEYFENRSSGAKSSKKRK